MNELLSSDAQMRAEVIVRDKDGNIKYQGPLVLTPIKEPTDGRNAQHSG